MAEPAALSAMAAEIGFSGTTTFANIGSPMVIEVPARDLFSDWRK